MMLPAQVTLRNVHSDQYNKLLGFIWWCYCEVKPLKKSFMGMKKAKGFESHSKKKKEPWINMKGCFYLVGEMMKSQETY